MPDPDTVERTPNERTPGDRVTLYPHGAGREWSTAMHDEWKRDLGQEYVPAAALDAAREALRQAIRNEQHLRERAARAEARNAEADALLAEVESSMPYVDERMTRARSKLSTTEGDDDALD